MNVFASAQLDAFTQAPDAQRNGAATGHARTREQERASRTQLPSGHSCSVSGQVELSWRTFSSKDGSGEIEAEWALYVLNAARAHSKGDEWQLPSKQRMWPTSGQGGAVTSEH